MFGFVMANTRELTRDQLDRYNQVYCGVCRQIRSSCSQIARLGLSFDCAFLALLLMSLYEPEETAGTRACALHPIRPRPWLDNEYIRYGADMNVALAYYKALDDCADGDRFTARTRSNIFGTNLADIEARFPRQCRAIAQCTQDIARMEREGCPNPDEPATCFGSLLGELLVYREDLWAPTLRQMGMGLGRFIYLADAAVDFSGDRRKGRYNPFLAMGADAPNWEQWEQYLVLAMGLCTDYYQRLPLVQDKQILDNILYRGVWLQCRRRKFQSAGGRTEEENDRRSL